MYPIKFKPILNPTIWGGNNISLYKQISQVADKIGESWEISQVADNVSVVSNGELAGKTLSELIEVYGSQLLGEKIKDRFDDKFPLLIKFIDACDDLSIQVHPNDEIAAKRHNSLGKTEMWYVVDAAPDASLIIGFAEDCTRDEYLEALKAEGIENLLQKVPVSKGDVMFIPAGLVHAIGKGVVVAEIQQSSDITYRIYDYKRKDANGKERQLHTDEALDVIDFSQAIEPKIKYNAKINKNTPLVQCDYFTTNVLRMNEEFVRNYTSIDSFVVYICLEGDFVIDYNEEKTTVNKGETVLIPASIDRILLIPEKEVTLLEVFVSENHMFEN